MTTGEAPSNETPAVNRYARPLQRSPTRTRTCPASSSISNGSTVASTALLSGPTTAAHIHEDLDYESHCSVDEPAVCNTNPPAGGPHWNGACGSTSLGFTAFCGPAPGASIASHGSRRRSCTTWNTAASSSGTTHRPARHCRAGEMAEAHFNDQRIIVMAPYPDMEADTIAATSWSRIDKFPASDYSRERDRSASSMSTSAGLTRRTCPAVRRSLFCQAEAWLPDVSAWKRG